MNTQEFKAILAQAKDDPTFFETGRDEIDKLLLGVIQIEKKHLYGLDVTSPMRRQEEIKNFLDKNIDKILGE